MTENIHYHSRREEGNHSKEILYQTETETQQGKFQILLVLAVVKELRWFCPPSFADCYTLLFFKLVLLVSTLLSSVASLNHGERFHNSLTPLKPELHAYAVKVLCLLGVEAGPSLSYICPRVVCCLPVWYVLSCNFLSLSC